MSEENVELVRERFKRFAATNEFDSDWFDPGFVLDMSTFTGWPEKQHYKGVEGIREFLSSWLEAWDDDWRLELDEVLDAGDDKAVAIASQYGRSKSAGVEVEMRFAQIWTFRGERLVRMQVYASPRDALEAAGLSE